MYQDDAPSGRSGTHQTVIQGRLQEEAEDSAGTRKRTPPGWRTRARQGVRWVRMTARKSAGALVASGRREQDAQHGMFAARHNGKVVKDEQGAH